MEKLAPSLISQVGNQISQIQKHVKFALLEIKYVPNKAKHQF